MDFLFPLFSNRPPTCSTLFPYTTLFRSLLARLGNLSTEASFNRSSAYSRIIGTPDFGYVFGFSDDPTKGQKAQDRKSTRLNSSHRCISYAVFCLKKKKKNRHTNMQLC